MWYHVSNNFIGNEVLLELQLPKIDNIAQQLLEGNIPRICVSSSVFKCLRAKCGFDHISTIQWERAEENPCVYFTEEVPFIPPSCSDFRNNDERWFLKNTKFYFLGRIDMYKLFTKEVLVPTKEVKIKLPKKPETIYKVKEEFLRRITQWKN